MGPKLDMLHTPEPIVEHMDVGVRLDTGMLVVGIHIGDDITVEEFVRDVEVNDVERFEL